jgi:hypothetical protein
MVGELIETLLRWPGVTRVVLTRNIPEPLTMPSDPRLTVIENAVARGFGANHNAAFRLCREPWFCILNPDIQLAADPFAALVRSLQRHRAALAAPRIVDADGRTEDSFRIFPTLPSLLAKIALGREGRFPCAGNEEIVFPDWVAGMFMLVDAGDFAAVGGFDERYFLYYEDADLCARLQLRGRPILVDLTVAARHSAQRASHRNLRHLRWHLASAARFLWRYRGGLARGGRLAGPAGGQRGA